jgi:hypothetical protein
MAIQQRNDEMISLATADLQRRYESSFAWKTACSMYQALTGLRGFWPMSAMQSGGDCFDQSGNSRTLTYNGNPVYDFDGLAPYLAFDGTGDYLSRVDEGGLDILGTEAYVGAGHRGLTLGGWFYPEDDANAQTIISKWNAAGNERSYRLLCYGSVAGDPVNFRISDDGTNFDAVTSITGYALTTWQFIAGRFNDADAGEELAVWRNDEKTTAATARASIWNSAAPFNISGHNNGTALYTGRASLCFLCAAALDDATIWALYQHTRALFRV